MLFNTRHFELYFEEKILKKGLKLFNSAAVDLIEKQGSSEFQFIISGHELVLRKKGEGLSMFKCSCQADGYCAHLAAALFYLQQESLTGLAKKKIVSKPSAVNSSLINGISESEINYFIQSSSKSTLQHSALVPYLHDLNEETCFSAYCSLLNTLLSPYYELAKLNQKQVNEAHLKISRFTQKLALIKSDYENEFYLRLALFCEMQSFMQLRFTGVETLLQEELKNTISYLDTSFYKGLNSNKKSAWQEAVFICLSKNQLLRMRGYVFLVPRYLSWLRAKPAFERLKDVLSKRKYKIPFHTALDELAMVKLQVLIREEEILKTKRTAKDSNWFVEEIIASAELAFCEGRNKKAFDLLEINYPDITQTYKRYFEEYTAYVVLKAKEKNKIDIELKYLEERLIKGLFMLPNDLDRYFDLLEQNNETDKIETLLSEIKNNRRYYSFEKLSVLLQRLNRPDELIAEIKKHGNSYRLLHSLVLQKLPEYSREQVLLYIKQFISSLNETKVYGRQLALFDTAREYIDRLPEELRNMVLDKIITHSGSESQVSRYIRVLYSLE